MNRPPIFGCQQFAAPTTAHHAICDDCSYRIGILVVIVWLVCAVVVAGQSQREQQVLLDLSKKETYTLLQVNADPEQVRITDVKVSDLPTAHRLIPESGCARLGQPLDIQLKEPGNVRIRLALVKRGRDLALRVSPQIVLGQHTTIELTQDRITRTARNLRRRVKTLNQQLARLAQERQALHLWLISPGNKPLDSFKVARTRMKILDQAIKARQREVPVAQSQCAALGQAAEFIRKLHKKVKIRYQVTVVGELDYRTRTGERSPKPEIRRDYSRRVCQARGNCLKLGKFCLPLNRVQGEQQIPGRERRHTRSHRVCRITWQWVMNNPRSEARSQKSKGIGSMGALPS